MNLIVYESKKCIKCEKYFGMKENNFLCSSCSGIKLSNLKVIDNIEVLKEYKYFTKKHISVINNLIKNRDKLKDTVFKNIYTIITKKSKFDEELIAFVFNLCIGLLSYNILPDNIIDIYSINKTIDNIMSICNSTMKPKYLLSLKQAENLIDLIKLENYNKDYLLSHSIAKWLKKPWIQSEKFHTSSLCFYGNFGEVPILKHGYLFKRNHNIFI